MKTATWNRKHGGLQSTVLGKEARTQLLEWIKSKAYSDTQGKCTDRHPFPPPPPHQVSPFADAICCTFFLHLLSSRALHRELCTNDTLAIFNRKSSFCWIRELRTFQWLTLHLSTKSPSATMSTERGSCPGGAFSGISWRQMFKGDTF